nr:triphosphoribosyl-dephospho-CoA synthase CitG [uncultured Enterobacter sp.]
MAGLLAIKPAPVDVPALVLAALHRELDLTPKPGLVDSLNNGAHRDMDHALFVKSIRAIAPWFPRFEQLGREHAQRPAGEQLRLIRPMGIACEQAMLRATHGVNTHKGGIFSLGLLSVAAGRIGGQARSITALTLCDEVALMCQGLVARELATPRRAATAGERQYQAFGLTGARGEVESGFATVRRFVLPYWRNDLHDALLRLMAVNQDSNVVSRGGLDGLRYVQRYATHLLHNGWSLSDLAAMDAQCIARNLSPGGSADLLSVACVLAGVNAVT